MMNTMAYPIHSYQINFGTSIRMDVLALALAFAVHAPFYFMKFDVRKKAADRATSRLVSIDLIEAEALKAPPPLPPPVAEKSLMEKLKALIRKEPPPPAPVKKAEPPKELQTGPKEIKLEPKLNEPEKIAPRLQTKSGFKTTVDPTLVQQKQIDLKAGGPGAAPLSEKRLGLVTDRRQTKSDRGQFELSTKETVKAIGEGEGGAKLADASAPAIAIRTGRGTVEKFSAPPPSMADKGKLGNVGVAGVGEDKKLGLRDSIIARDAAPAMIDTGQGRSSGGTGGGSEAEGAVAAAVKKDAGRSFQSGPMGGVSGGGAAGLMASAKEVPKIAPIAPKKEKKSMFMITGPLKDRKIDKKVVPDYPAWAIAQGIEASVVLEFTVTPEGFVKDSIVVRRTSGYSKLDELSIQSLKKWKFVPLEESREEVGTITFNYALD